MKKFLTLLLALAMLMTMLVGCGEKAKDEDESEGEESSYTDSSEPAGEDEEEADESEEEADESEEEEEVVVEEEEEEEVKPALTGASSAEAVIETFFESMFATGDGATMLNVLPDVYVENTMEEEGLTREEMAEQLSEVFAMTAAMVEELGAEVTWEFVSTYEMDEDEIEWLIEDIVEYTEVELDVTAATEMEVLLTVEAEGEETEEETFTLTAIKIGGKWYVDPVSFSSM